jgi:hypothetical protein
MQHIGLENSDLVTLVDDDIYEDLKHYSWYLFLGNRCRATIPGRGRVEMGRMVLGLVDDEEVDHIDRYPLNNQRSNLRPSTRAQNQQNRNDFKNNTSGYKGVSQRHPTAKFVARIRVAGQLIELGRWVLAEDAAKAYDDAASYYWGHNASLNFPR